MKTLCYTLLLMALFACQDEDVKDPTVETPDTEQSQEKTAQPIFAQPYESVDFDALYGACSGKTLVSNIQSALSQLDKNEILIFNSEHYDFEGISWSIDHSARLSGRILTDSLSGELKGSGELVTTFDNLKQLKITANQVELYNLELVESPSATQYVMINLKDRTNASYLDKSVDYVTGLTFRNLRILRGKAQIYANSGAGGTFSHITFRDFEALGFAMNRAAAVDQSPQLKFDHCLFESPDINFYNLRGISFDAGNTDYAMIWDLNDTQISHCRFNRTGLGFSKCQHATVTHCEFHSDNLNMDQIHMEEFTNHIEITHNLFHHIKPSRGMYIDRERQRARQITIKDNTFTGQIGWVISSYSPEGLIFEGNDFTQATISKRGTNNEYVFDFAYDMHAFIEQGVGYHFATKGLVFRNNPGLSSQANGRMFQLKGDQSNHVEGISMSSIEIDPYQPLFGPGTYRLRNYKTKQYITAEVGASYASLTTDPQASTYFDFTFQAPQNYHLWSPTTQTYLEAYIIWTLNHVQNPATAPDDTDLLIQHDFAGKTRYPSFVIAKSGHAATYLLHPGANERKSCVGVFDGRLKLGAGRDAVETPSSFEHCLWEIEQVK